MAENDARQCLDLDVADRLALLLREVADLGLREGNILDIPLAELRQAVLDLALREPVVLPVPFVERDRQFAHCSVAAGGDIRQDRLDGRSYLGVGRGDLGRVPSTLEPILHRALPDGDAHDTAVAYECKDDLSR